MKLILHLTHDCQLRCLYCYGGARRHGSMSWTVAKRALDMLLEKPAGGGTQPAEVCFFGGEPLLEWALLTQCIPYAEGKAAASGRPLELSITTNGLALDEDKADYLAGHGLNVVLSFDGVREAQDASRRRNDGGSSFDATLRALRLLQERLEAPTVCAVVSPSNVRYLAASVDLLLSEGVKRLMLNPDFFSEWRQEDLDLWRQGYEHAAMRFEQSYLDGMPVNVNLFTAKIITHLKGGYDSSDCCLFGEGEIAVAPSGRNTPASEW